MNLSKMKVGEKQVVAKHTEADFEKEKKALISKLHDAYQLSKHMEGNSMTGQEMNEDIMQLIEKFKGMKFKSWSEFQA